MPTPRVLLVDGDPGRAAATADRLGRAVGQVTVAPPDDLTTSLAAGPTDAVLVVGTPSATDTEATAALVRRARDVPVVVAAADEADAYADGVADTLFVRVRHALDAADRPVPVLALDGRSRVVRLGDDAAALLGLDPTTAVGRPLAAVLPGADALHETVANAVADGEPWTATVSRDGAGHVEAWVVPTAGGVDCLLRDVTDRVARTAALRRQRDRLEEFAQTVAHDLRNPLAVASGRLDLLAERAAVDPADDDLRALRAALDRATDLVDDTLRFARESTVDDLEPVDVATVARGAWETAPTEEATLDVRPVGRVLADPEALRRLFENLYRNAVEHARPDVTVTFGPCVGDDGPGFFVADDGPGVPPDDRDRAFDRSFSTAGGGVGLAVVRQVATAHGWSVRVTDATDGGARFEVTGVAAADETDAVDATTPPANGRVLRRTDGGVD